MAIEILMPKLGMTMEEGKLLEWSVVDKASVSKGETVLVVETDKVSYDVESTADGLLLITKPADEIYAVGTILGYLAESEVELAGLGQPAVDSTPAQPAATAAESATAADSKAAPPKPSGSKASDPKPSGPKPSGKVRATPGARKLAKQKGIDLTAINGSGPQGRVTKEDVIKAIEAPPAPPAVPAPAPAAAVSAAPAAPISTAGKTGRQEAMSGMRATISRRMAKSLQTTAQMTALGEWDATELMRLRKSINASAVTSGLKVSIPGLISFFLARVLKEMPILNASIDGHQIHYWNDANIGVAVAVDDGLMVPVLHAADKITLAQLQSRLDDLIERARTKKLLPDDMAGGTFTLSNLGSYGSDWETVILNPPEVALLGIGNITKKPVVIDDEIVIRQMMPVSLTFDHRLIDGAVAGAFRQRMKQLVETPGLIMTCLNPNPSS